MNTILTLFQKNATYFWGMLTILLLGCSNIEEPSTKNAINNSLHSANIQKRSFNEALEIAQQTIGMFNSDNSRSVTEKKIALSDTKFIINKSISRNSCELDTLMYIFNFENNQGFSIISANKATDALLAQAEQGNYDETTKIENPAFGMYMDLAEQYISNQRMIEQPILPIVKEHKWVNDTTETIRILPKVTVCWGQTGCEATYTTNGYSGCGNTAMAQIMSYFNHPTQLPINYPNASVSSVTLDWDQMKLHNFAHSIQSCTVSNETHNAIGLLHRQLGHLNNSSYQATGTFTYSSDIRLSFNSLGYTVSDFKIYTGESLYSLLANNYLCYMRGEKILEDSTIVGHGWVVDGYLKHEIVASEWTRDSNLFGAEWELLAEYDPYYTEYYHMNWGWDGNCNGYFKTNIFETNKALEYDNTSNNFYNSISGDYKNNVYYFSITR